MKRFSPPTLPVARPVHRLASAAGADDVPAVDELLRAMRLCHGMLGSSRIVMRRHSELMHSVSETMAATTAELAALRSEVVGLRAEVATLLLPPAAAPPATAPPATAPCAAAVRSYGQGQEDSGDQAVQQVPERATTDGAKRGQRRACLRQPLPAAAAAGRCRCRCRCRRRCRCLLRAPEACPRYFLYARVNKVSSCSIIGLLRAPEARLAPTSSRCRTRTATRRPLALASCTAHRPPCLTLRALARPESCAG